MDDHHKTYGELMRLCAVLDGEVEATPEEMQRARDSLLAYSIEYDEGADDDERFTLMEIVSPHNDHHSTKAWVPSSMASELALELANARRKHKGDKYHHLYI